MDDKELINYQLQQIQAQNKEIIEGIEGLAERTRKIEHHLYNDNETDSDGIVKRVHKIDNRLKILEDKDKVKEAKLGVWGIVGGAAVMFIWEAIKYLISSHKS